MKKLLIKNNKGSAGCLVVVAIVIVLLIIGAIISAFSPEETKETTTTTRYVPTAAPTKEYVIDLDYPVSTEEASDDAETTTKAKKKTVDQAKYIYKKGSDFEITMLDVGQGLCLLIRADDKYIMYDGGGKSKSSYVVSYLKKHNIKELSAIIVSHYDEDHIAGLVGVLNKYSVLNVICPEGESDIKIYKSFKEKLDKSGAKVIHPILGDRFSFGNAEFLVLNPKSYENNDDNNSSIAIRITCGAFACLITGDCESEAELEMIKTLLDLRAHLLVLGHHGSKNSSSKEFIKEVDPDYAFISCGKKNKYGHPDQSTLDRLYYYSVKLFRSDKQGEVTCYVNLKDDEFGFSTNYYDNYDQGGITTTTTQKQTTHVEKYVLNTHTYKFHRPNCPSVDQMYESNMRIVVCNREELIAEGYKPCGRCGP